MGTVSVTKCEPVGVHTQSRHFSTNNARIDSNMPLNRSKIEVPFNIFVQLIENLKKRNQIAQKLKEHAN